MSHFLHREAEASRAIKLLNQNSDFGLSDPNAYILFTVVHQIHRFIECSSRMVYPKSSSPLLGNPFNRCRQRVQYLSQLMPKYAESRAESRTQVLSPSPKLFSLYLVASVFVIMCVLLGFQHLIDSLCQILKTGLKIQATK